MHKLTFFPASPATVYRAPHLPSNSNTHTHRFLQGILQIPKMFGRQTTASGSDSTATSGGNTSPANGSDATAKHSKWVESCVFWCLWSGFVSRKKFKKLLYTPMIVNPSVFGTLSTRPFDRCTCFFMPCRGPSCDQQTSHLTSSVSLNIFLFEQNTRPFAFLNRRNKMLLTMYYLVICYIFSIAINESRLQITTSHYQSRCG